MAEYVIRGLDQEVKTGDILLAILIAAGVVIGDFIIAHLPI